jgi:hypothetical protein
MLDGSYQAALGVLRQALAAATPGSLTYAYALFDLGRSLRLSGQAGAAVLVLEQRLKIPNQPEVVRQELKLALTATGGAAPAAAKPTPAHGAAGLGPRDRVAKRRSRSSDHGD